MSHLLFKDKSICPECRRRSKPKHFRECSCCGQLLFLHQMNFVLWEREGNTRYWWCWMGERGWMHRDWFMEKNAETFKPLEREYKAPKLDPSYGRHTTPEAVAKRGAKRRPVCK